MSSEKSHSAPPFKSQLPETLLTGLNDRDKFLYQSIDEMKQAQGWLVEQAIVHTETLMQVREQATKTNGRLLAVESQVKDADPAIRTVRSTVKAVKSKAFWVGTIVFITVVLPWIVSHAPPPERVIKWAMGAST